MTGVWWFCADEYGIYRSHLQIETQLEQWFLIPSESLTGVKTHSKSVFEKKKNPLIVCLSVCLFVFYRNSLSALIGTASGGSWRLRSRQIQVCFKPRLLVHNATKMKIFIFTFIWEKVCLKLLLWHRPTHVYAPGGKSHE